MRLMQDNLSETFNRPLDTTELPSDSMLHQMGEFSASMIGGQNFKMHKINGAGYLIQFDKDGAREFHHLDDDLQGGYAKNNKASFGFVTTLRKHIKDSLDNGHDVRVVAHQKLAGPLERITRMAVDRTPGYAMSPSIPGNHELTGDPTVSWTLTKQ
jgi:hypothetical protein